MTTAGCLTQKEPQELKRIRRAFSKRSPKVSQQDAFTMKKQRLGVRITFITPRKEGNYTYGKQITVYLGQDYHC